MCDTAVMARPPLKDVSALAGVSEPTVSRVLNGRVGVAEHTRRRVVDALAQLGFEEIPEPRSERRHVVGLITGEFLNPVFGAYAHYLATELARKGYLTTIAVTEPSVVPEERCIAELTRNGVDAIVFIGGHHARVDSDCSHYDRLVTDGTPVVLVNGRDTGIDVPHVRCDEEIGARKAVEHLIGLGHTEIGCVVGPALYVPTRRLVSGYRDTLAERHLSEPPGAVAEVPFTLEGGRAGAIRLLETGLTAVIASNDLMALGAISASRSLDRDLAVVGYDGTEFTALSNPPLTTLRQPFEEMTRMITDAVIDEIHGGHHFRDQFVFEPDLVVRESAPPARAVIA